MQVNYNKTSYEDWLAKSYVKQMSGNQHNRQAATWRKLYLSRAKLKASSSTSALLSGFAMVRMELKYMFVAFTDYFFYLNEKIDSLPYGTCYNCILY